MELIQFHNICKGFSGVNVLHNITFSLNQGDVLGLIGENGAGKSTLMKIISGIYQADSGGIFFEGVQVHLRSPKDAKQRGICLIPQEFNLCSHLTAVENIFLGSELMDNRVLNERQMNKQARDILSHFGVSFPADAQIGSLSVAEKQFVEIAKAMVLDAKVIIMDEPTTMLTTKEIDVLFELIKKLQGRGVSIIYISHKLAEIKHICNRVVILRDGVLVHSVPVKDITTSEMVSKMVGRDLSQIFPAKTDPSSEVVFEARNISSPQVFSEMSFQVRAGEIFGLAGLVGAGRTEVAEAIIGLRKLNGSLLVEGEPTLIKTPRDAINCGISYLSEDRQTSGIITTFNILENTTLVSLEKYSPGFGQLVNTKEEYDAATKYREMFSIKTSSLYKELAQLSGGNQQKVALGKALDTAPKILIVDEPTRGVDVAAKQEIYSFLSRLAQSGMAVVVISSELEEILGLCNRVAVLREGYLSGILDSSEMSETEIMFLATGIRKGAAV